MTSTNLCFPDLGQSRPPQGRLLQVVAFPPEKPNPEDELVTAVCSFQNRSSAGRKFPRRKKYDRGAERRVDEDSNDDMFSRSSSPESGGTNGKTCLKRRNTSSSTIPAKKIIKTPIGMVLLTATALFGATSVGLGIGLALEMRRNCTDGRPERGGGPLGGRPPGQGFGLPGGGPGPNSAGSKGSRLIAAPAVGGLGKGANAVAKRGVVPTPKGGEVVNGSAAPKGGKGVAGAAAGAAHARPGKGNKTPVAAGAGASASPTGSPREGGSKGLKLPGVEKKRPPPAKGPAAQYQYSYSTRPPIPLLLSDILHPGRTPINAAEVDDPAPASLYLFSGGNNECYMAATFSSILRTPATRKYLHDSFCPAVSRMLSPQDAHKLDEFGGYQYGFPNTFCNMFWFFINEDHVGAEQWYQNWKALFFKKPIPPVTDADPAGLFPPGRQQDMDDAIRTTFAKLAVPRPAPNGFRFEELQDRERNDDDMRKLFPAGGYLASVFADFYGDLGITKFIALKGYGDLDLDAIHLWQHHLPESWQDSRCLRESAAEGASDSGLTLTPPIPNLPVENPLAWKGEEVTLPLLFAHEFLHAEHRPERIRAWHEEPLPNAPDECLTDNGQGEFHGRKLTRLPKSGLLPIFLKRTLFG
eukprot:g7555.t1